MGFGVLAEEAGLETLFIWERGGDATVITNLRFRWLNRRLGDVMRPLPTIRLHRSGRPFDVSLTLSPVKNEAGEMIGASTISRDISIRKQAEAELLKMRDDLEVRVAERTRGLTKKRGRSPARSPKSKSKTAPSSTPPWSRRFRR